MIQVNYDFFQVNYDFNYAMRLLMKDIIALTSHEFQHMGLGQEGQVDIVRSDFEQRRVRYQGPGEVGMGEQHALGIARRPAGVHDDSSVVRRGGNV